MSQMSEKHEADLPPAGFIPASLLPLFWRPRFLSRSPILVYVPSLFWLVEALQARRIAVLGVGDGTAHFALCQALEKSNRAGSCDGIWFWSDASGDTREVPATLSEHNESLYDGLSYLHASADLQEACQTLNAKKYDLLVIDLANLPSEDLAWDDISALVSVSGLLVIHGHTDLPTDSAAAAFIDSNAILRLDDGKGLALCSSSDIRPAISALVNANQTPEDDATATMFLRRLGQGLVAMEDARALRRKTVEQAQSLTELEDIIASTKSQKDLLQKGYELRGHKLAEVQVRLFDIENTHAKVQRQVESHERILATERSLRFEETAALTRMLEKERQILAKSRKDQETGADSIAALKAENARLSSLIAGLLSSTSWKITAPVRKLRLALKKR